MTECVKKTCSVVLNLQYAERTREHYEERSLAVEKELAGKAEQFKTYETSLSKLKKELIKAAADVGWDLHVSGIPSLFYLRLADDPSLMVHQEWIAECVRRGVFFTSHHNHFVNASLTDEDIAETVSVAKEALEVVKLRHPEL